MGVGVAVGTAQLPGSFHREDPGTHREHRESLIFIVLTLLLLEG